jgi:hypothetical protein
MSVSNLSTGLRPGVCTSTTRPVVPYEGQHIYETDTDLVYLWSGSAWVETVSALTKAPRGVMALTTTSTSTANFTTEIVTITGLSFTAVANRYYKVTYFEPVPSSVNATGNLRVRIRLTNISGTVMSEAYTNLPSSGVSTIMTNVVWVGTLTAGTTNFVGTMTSGTGTAGTDRTASRLAVLLVEDIGSV